MHFRSAFSALVLMLRGVSAQGDLLSALPDCAAQCMEETIGTSECSPTDIPCLCVDQDFMLAAQGCQALSCSVKDVLTSTNATLAACGVPPTDHTATVIAIPASFGSLAILLVLVRVFGRIYVTQVNLDWDDYLIIAATVFAGVLNFVCYPMAEAGMGTDLWTIPFPDINKTFKLLYIAEIFYMFAEMLVQLSILAFYVRVFPIDSGLVRVGSWILMGVVICFGIANTFTMIFQCTPVHFFWNSWHGEMTGTCIDISLFSWLRAAIEIVIDVCILSLPLPSLLKLQMSARRRFQVIIMFVMGFVITAVSIARLQSIVEFSVTANPTLDNAPAIYWSVLECDMFIICACLPAVRSVLSRLLPGVFGSTAQTSYPSGAKYYRHDGSKGEDPSSHQLSQFDQPERPNKSGTGVSVDVYSGTRTASDEHLMYPPRTRSGTGGLKE